MASGKALIPATPQQGVLDLGVEVERVVAGVEMGVFRNDYLVTRFPRYILTKAHLLGGQSEAQRIGTLYQSKAIAAPHKPVEKPESAN